MRLVDQFLDRLHHLDCILEGSLHLLAIQGNDYVLLRYAIGIHLLDIYSQLLVLANL